MLTSEKDLIEFSPKFYSLLNSRFDYIFNDTELENLNYTLAINADSFYDDFNVCVNKLINDMKEISELNNLEEIEINNLSQLLIDLEEFTESYMEIHKNELKNPAIEYFEIKRNQQIRSLLTAILIKRKTEIITEEVYNTAITNLRNFFFIFTSTDCSCPFTYTTAVTYFMRHINIEPSPQRA